MRVEQLLDVALEADAARGQQHDVVADALDVGDDVRGDDDGGRRLGDAVHQQLEQFSAGERVEARERLVEQDELRPLAEHERERESARSPSDSDPTFVFESMRVRRSVAASSSHSVFVRRANSIVSATLNER